MTSSKESAALALAHSIVGILDDHKGEDILLMDLRGVCGFADYFVLCTGVSERTLRALADEVMRQMKADGRMLAHGAEGEPADGWILLDYGDVIAHLFSRRLREYYRLEEVWRTGTVVLRVQ